MTGLRKELQCINDISHSLTFIVQCGNAICKIIQPIDNNRDRGDNNFEACITVITCNHDRNHNEILLSN